MAKRSGLFGGSSSTQPSTAEEQAKELARRLMQELEVKPVGPAPVFAQVGTQATVHVPAVAEEANKEEQEQEVLFTPQEDRVTKQKRTDVLVLSNMSKKRSRAIDEERAELEQEKTGSDASTTIAVDGEEGEVDVVEIKKKKKKSSKKDKGLLSSDAASTPSSSAPASDDEAFKPFDYSNAPMSVVDQTIANSSKRKQKKKADANAPPEPFDPYTKLVERPISRRKTPPSRARQSLAHAA